MTPRQRSPHPATGDRREVLAAASRLARRANRARLAGECLRRGTLALVAAGASILVLRTAFALSAGRASWSLLLVLAATATALVRARARRLSPSAALAWLDARTGGTGLLLTAAASGDPRWRERTRAELLRAPAAPRLALGRWPQGLAGAAALVAFALLVPVPRAAAAVPGPLLARSVDRLASEVDLVEEVLPLEPAVEQELEERLEGLRDSLAAAQPDATYEAKDRLEQSLATETARALERLADASRQLEGALHDADSDAVDAALDSPELQGVLPDALRDLASAGSLGEEAAGRLRAAQAELREEGDAARLGRLLAGSPELSAALAKRLEHLPRDVSTRLCEGGSCSAGLAAALQRFQAGREGEPQATEASAASAAAASGPASAGDPGRGGVSQGPGPAPLQWEEETAAVDASQFVPRALPPARRDDPGATGVVGLGASDPEVAPERGSGGSAAGRAALGESPGRRRLAPRHRRAVRALFSAGDDGAGGR